MEKIWVKNYEKGVLSHLEYPSVTIPEVFRNVARKFANHTSMVYMEHKWTYQELDELSSRMANLLKEMRIKPGDRVGIQLPNSPQFVISYYGALRVGAITVPVNPQFSGDDLSFIVKDSGMKVLVIYKEHLPALEAAGVKDVRILVTDVFAPFSADNQYSAPPPAEKLEEVLFRQPAVDPQVSTPPDSIANLQYTGGTTGLPKGAILTHRNLVVNCIQFREWFKNIYKDGEGIFICVIPFFHIYGMTTSMNSVVFSGSTMLILPKFDLNELMRLIQKYKPNLFMGVPAMYGAIVAREGHHYDLSSIKACMSGSAPLPLAVQDAFEKLTNGKLREGYGLSEASPVVACNPVDGLFKNGSVGLPFPDTDVRIVDSVTGQEVKPSEVGELTVKGPQVMQGYWHQEEETAMILRDGWLHTGDLARMDEDGYIYITDRLKDMIIMGGEKIYPREIEELLYMHPAVKDAGVVGARHPLRGEVPVAYVVLKEGASATEKDLRQYCSAHLSKFKVPHRIEFVDALPRNTAGKVLRRVLRDLARESNSA